MREEPCAIEALIQRRDGAGRWWTMAASYRDTRCKERRPVRLQPYQARAHNKCSGVPVPPTSAVPGWRESPAVVGSRLMQLVPAPHHPVAGLVEKGWYGLPRDISFSPFPSLCAGWEGGKSLRLRPPPPCARAALRDTSGGRQIYLLVKDIRPRSELRVIRDL